MAAISERQERQDALRSLPPLTLPPRQLKKARVSCCKWLARFVSTIAALRGGASNAGGDAVEAIVERLLPSHDRATGFLALNGGLLAGCTPFDLRHILDAHGLLDSSSAAAAAPSPHHSGTPPTCEHMAKSPAPASMPSPVLQYSSTLPFVLGGVPLRVRGGDAGLSVMFVTPTELARFAAAAAVLDLPPSCADAAPDADGAAVPVAVVVLQVPPEAALWKAGSTATATAATSSAKRGCGFLYVVPCDVAAVRSFVGHALQRPVVGVEALLGPSRSLASLYSPGTVAHVAAGDGAAAAAPSPLPQEAPRQPGRTCRSRAVPEVPGLFMVADFVSAAEEADIWAELYEGRQQLRLEYLSRRRVAHFNRRFCYGVNALTAVGEEVNARPRFYDWMQARLRNDAAGGGGLRIDGAYPAHPGDCECDQLTVNYYDCSEVGACGIAAHVDAHNAFDDCIFIVSLGSYTVMEFARWDTPAEVAAPVGVYLAPRSLVVLTGEARYGWTHCIAEKRTDTLSELLPTVTRGDRVSLTWRRGRTQRHVRAACPYPAVCDGE
ncbi:2OG-Fe(II) oxygenase superfamily [Novymonas esmeraldas]|uniref:2OG-Fe(II) oxygenase superfamily n=1 Tax=Novymonas esmeraldas TaxID=1808958 RepID=A0AAW0F5S3_9TRYP